MSAFGAHSEGLHNMTDPARDVLHASNATTTDGTILGGDNNVTLGLDRFALDAYIKAINQNYPWVVLCLGFPGNVMSLLTILRMPAVSSSKMHVAVLAISDNCAIVSKLLYHQLTRHLVVFSDLACKFVLFSGNYFSILSSWVLVAMTLERFIAVWFPLKVSRIYSKRKATAVLIAIICLTFAFNSVYFVVSNVDPRDGSCHYGGDYHDFMVTYWYWADALIFSIVPCLLVIVSNSLIISNVLVSSKTQRQLTNNYDQCSRRMREQQQITTMLIVISVVFLVLMLPNSIFYIISEPWKKATDDNSYERLVYYFVQLMIHVLCDMNHAVNFYLYFLSMATFRRRFLDTLQCRKRAARTPKGASTSVFRTSHSYVSFHSTQSNLKARAYAPVSTGSGGGGGGGGGVSAGSVSGSNGGSCKGTSGGGVNSSHPNHSMTNLSDVSSEV